MKGTLVITGQDAQKNIAHGILFEYTVIPADERDVAVRNLMPGAEVTFATDKETGVAHLGTPLPVRGCEAR